MSVAFDLTKFCGTDGLVYKFSLPWRKDGKVFATDGSILFIGYANDFPDVGQPEGKVPDVAGLRIHEIIGYLPVYASEIKNAIDDIQPIKEYVYEKIKCAGCDGKGIVPCECFNCGHCHEKTCSNCKGDGYVKGDIVIEEKYRRTPVRFRGVAIDWKYLSLIKDSMEFWGGEWEVSIRGELDIAVFKNTSVTIAVMPMRIPR